MTVARREPVAGERLDPAVARVRRAVRVLLETVVRQGLLAGGQVGVAVSGGADSLALAAATRQVADRLGLAVHAVVVDHRLQEDSATVAAQAAEQLRTLGLDGVRVVGVEVRGPGGPEAAARRARYAALRAALPTPDALMLLGHTRDDQAETVLLGLGRGSGARSIAGMRPLDPPWARPLLDLDRATTAQACAALGLHPWQDPHNTDARYTRVRLRHEVLPLLEDVLQGGVSAALARTAAQLREDGEALDAVAHTLAASVRAGVGLDATIDAPALAAAPAAIRRRVLRGWLLAAGVTELTDAHLRNVDALASDWRGQGVVALPGGLVAGRAHGRLRVDRTCE